MNPSPATPRTIVVASRNDHKLREIGQLVRGLPIVLRSLADFESVPDIVEDGATFLANATKKAQMVARTTGYWALGEDSGLEVDALEGAPGIHSARFSGGHGNHEANNQLLLERLKDVPDERRTARYTCTAVLASPDEVLFSTTAHLQGLIARELRGSQGFGYDPLFYLPEYHCTVGELGPLVKNAISHRARAMERLLRALRTRGL